MAYQSAARELTLSNPTITGGTITGATVGGMSTAQQAFIASDMDLRHKYLLRGYTLTGMSTPPEIAWNDFSLIDASGNPLGKHDAAGSGGRAASTTRRGSWRYYTGATGSSFAGVVANPTLALGGINTRWYIVVKFELNTAIDAATNLGIHIFDTSAHNVKCGVFGTVSTAYYSLVTSAGSSITTVAVDLNVPHVFEMYRSDGDVQLLIDGVLAATIAPPSWGTSDSIYPMLMYNGATAATREAIVQYWGIVTTGK